MEKATLKHEGGRTLLDATVCPSDGFFLVEEKALEGNGKEDNAEHDSENVIMRAVRPRGGHDCENDGCLKLIPEPRKRP